MNHIPAKLYSIDLESNIMIELNKAQKNSFNNAKRILNAYIEKDKAILLYRGDNIADLLERMGNEKINQLLDNIFHVGDKGKYFYQCDGYHFINKIDDISNTVFEYIFNRISEAEKNNNASNSFKQYFVNSFNKNDFIERINGVTDKTTKLRIRDYYLVYLHTVNGYYGDVMGNCSFFVSTSKEYEVAEGDTKDDEPFIVYCFLPKPYIDLAISNRNKKFLKENAVENEFPEYDTPFYLENEVSIKGALFPQNIFGIKCLIDGEETFVVNPYLFSRSTNLEKFPYIGIDVDQSRFSQKINFTNFKKAIIKTENKDFVEVLLQ